MPAEEFAAEQAAPQQPEPEDKDRASRALGTVLAIIVVIVLVLIFWRSCAREASNDSGSSAAPFVQTLENLDAIDDGVAVWVKPGTEIDDVLRRNQLRGARYTAFGEGTYVISIGDIDAEKLVDRLKEDPGLYDAGFVYLAPGSND